MKINEIIRERRIAKKLTQEQVASYLGVSTPAVNKWEKASTYPDITLLPALARLLDTDLNTLLSFKEELTEQEIGNFLNDLVSDAFKSDGKHTFQMAMDKIHEYPSCDSLILNTALTLESIFLMLLEEPPSFYTEKIEELYQRAAQSTNLKISNQAKSMLVSSYMSRQDYEHAKQLIENLPDEDTCHKKQLQIQFSIKRGDLKEALELSEQKLLMDVNNIYATLMTLMEITLSEQRIEDARQIADKLTQMVSVFDLWEYCSYVPNFLLTITEKNAEECLTVLKKMLPAMMSDWNAEDSLLYEHMKKKGKKDDRTIGGMMLTILLSDFEDSDNHEFDFLRENSDFKAFIKDFAG